MTHKTIQIEENAQHENESLVMMEREQGDLQRHDHLFFKLAYITGGTCEHTLNDIKTVLHRGDYFFVDLGSTHRYENSCGLTLINCLFLPEAIDETMRCCLSLNELLQACLVRYYRMILGANWTDCVFHDEDGRVGALLGGMVQEYRQMQFGSAEIFRGRLTEILILTLRKLAPERTLHTGCEAVEKAILYINRHYAHDVTLQDFCAGEHYSVPYISRRFRQETGLTFREYLRRTRIEKSCELLAGSSCPVSEAARASGYEDMQSYYAAFRQYLNMTPKEYRAFSRAQMLAQKTD